MGSGRSGYLNSYGVMCVWRCVFTVISGELQCAIADMGYVETFVGLTTAHRNDAALQKRISYALGALANGNSEFKPLLCALAFMICVFQTPCSYDSQRMGELTTWSQQLVGLTTAWQALYEWPRPCWSPFHRGVDGIV